MTLSSLESMAREIDRTPGHRTLRKQVADVFERAIRSGTYQPGDALPSEPQMSEVLGVSIIVIRHAMDDLRRDGLIVKRSGTVTRVAEAPTPRDISQTRYAEVLAQLDAGEEPTTVFLREQGITEDDYTLDLDYFRDSAGEADAEYLDIEQGDPVQRRHFIKLARGVPVQIQRSTIPWEIAKGTDLANPKVQPYPGGTVAELYRAGHRVTHISERIWGRMPTGEERQQLQLVSDGPVWDIVRTFYAGDPQRPVEASRVIREMATCTLVFHTDLSTVG